MPKTDTWSTGRPRTPPVTAPLVKISALIINASASVATARLVPRVRIAGSATTAPTIVVPATATSSATSNGHPLAETRRAAIHAPSPASAN